MSSPTRSIPAGSTVLVTGANGFIASHVIKQLLERSYKVRGSVRDVAGSQWLIDDHFDSYHKSGAFELVAVPDFTIDGAFDEAVKDVAGVIHLATVGQMSPNPNDVIPGTVASALTLLKSAAKESSVKELVYTSSIVATTWPVKGLDTAVKEDTFNEMAVQAAWAPEPYTPDRIMAVYAAGKTTAEQEVWKFVKEKKPSFSLNVICPSGVLGEPMNARHAHGFGKWIETLFRGDRTQLDPFPTAFFVDVKDVALLHVAALLDPEVDSARLQVWGINSNWNDLLEILRELRPQRQFIQDYDDPGYLTITADQSRCVALLNKWAGQKDWKSVRSTVVDSIETPYFKEDEL